MMAVLAAAFLISPAVSAQAREGQHAPAADVSAIPGKWTLSVDTPHGKMDLSLEMRIEKDKVLGTLESEMAGTRSFTGAFADGTLKFTTEGEENTLTFTGKFKDRDTITGYISGHAGDMVGVATRVKAPSKTRT
jgi:hypothetical protein